MERTLPRRSVTGPGAHTAAICVAARGMLERSPRPRTQDRTPPMPTRRTFLASAAAAIAAPRLFAAQTQDKSALKNPILGEGDHQYECIHDWGQLPRAIAYGNTHGVCEDSQGNIYIKHTVHATSTKDDAVVVFDADG